TGEHGVTPALLDLAIGRRTGPGALRPGLQRRQLGLEVLLADDVDVARRLVTRGGAGSSRGLALDLVVVATSRLFRVVDGGLRDRLGVPRRRLLGPSSAGEG